MKKVLLISVSALALSAGAAFAQNAVQTQYGAIPTVAVPGSAPQASSPNAYGNSSTIQQIGSGNTIGNSSGTGATYGVDQQANSWASANLSVINQGTATGNNSYNSSASVTQQGSTGYGQASSLINQDSGASGSSSSVGNSASVTQIVGGNQQVSYSTINQSGQGNIAAVNQGTVNTTSVNGVTSYVGQSGIGATASVSQQVDNAQSVVLQNGAGNGVPSGTSAGALPGTPNVYVSQTAGTDVSGVSQNSATLGTVSVTQAGYNYNTSQVVQTAAASATIWQGGNTNNQSAISQTRLKHRFSASF